MSFGIFAKDISLFSTIIPFLLLAFGLLLASLFFSRNITIVPSAWQQTLELTYNFIWSLLKEQVGERGSVYVPLFSALFLIILGANLLSLMPFGIAITSHVVITLFLSFSLIFTSFILGLLHQHWCFFNLFIPNCPLPLLFLLIPIELFSYFVRCFSLAIRLSANILAGHTLVVIVAGFILQLVQMRLWLFLPLISVLLLFFTLEFGVAFLQAYVFLVLSCIYLRDSLYETTH